MSDSWGGPVQRLAIEWQYSSPQISCWKKYRASFSVRYRRSAKKVNSSPPATYSIAIARCVRITNTCVRNGVHHLHWEVRYWYWFTTSLKCWLHHKILLFKKFARILLGTFVSVNNGSTRSGAIMHICAFYRYWAVQLIHVSLVKIKSTVASCGGRTYRVTSQSVWPYFYAGAYVFEISCRRTEPLPCMVVS